MSTYHGEAVCEGGHVISRYVSPGEHVDKFCSKCGRPVFTACQQPECGKPLRGAAHGVFVGGNYPPPNFCTECGKPFPWTLRLLERAKNAIDLHAQEQSVSDVDRAAVKAFADDLASGSATEAEITGMVARVRKFGSAGPIIWNGMKDIGTTFAAKLMVELAARLTGT